MLKLEKAYVFHLYSLINAIEEGILSNCFPLDKYLCMCYVSFLMYMIYVLDGELTSTYQWGSFESCDLVNFMSSFEYTL